MATPPTFVAAYGNTAWQTASQTVSVTVTAGDLIVIAAGTLDSNLTVSTPSGGGLTYTLQQAITSQTQQSNTYVWTATAVSSTTFTLTMSAHGQFFAWVAEVWRNHNGLGSSAKKTATSTTSLSLTTQGADSALFMVDNDWNGVDGTTRTYLTSVGPFTEEAYQRLSSSGNLGGFYAGHYADTGAVGSKTVGMSAPTGQRPSLIALEILAAPAAATGSLKITATTLPTNVPPAVKIDVNDTRSPGQASQLTIVRNNPDGTQTPVRTDDGNPLPLSGGIGLVYDYEMPLGQPVSYTALEVPAVASLQVTVNSSDTWLVHPGIPSLSVTVKLRKGSLAEETYTVTQGVFFPMGRTNPVVVTDGARHGASSSMIVSVQSLADLVKAKNLLADATPLLFNPPASDGLGFGPCYIAVGDVRVSRLNDIGTDPSRDITLTFQVVDRPAGGSQSARTYADVLAEYGSYQALLNANSSYADVLSGS